MKIAFVYLNYGYAYISPGLTKLMTFVKERGHEVMLVDPTFHFGSKKKILLTIY